MSDLDLQRQINELKNEIASLKTMEHSFAFKNLLFAENQIDSGATATYLKVASHPVSASDTGDSIRIELLGGFVASVNQFRMIIRAGNRSGFNPFIDLVSGDSSYLTHARLRAYSNVGIVTWYIYLPGIQYAFAATNILSTGWGVPPTIYPGETSSTAVPGGTLVFDSYTATSLLTQTNAGDIYSLPWTDVSGLSVTGWSTTGLTKQVCHKKIGNLNFLTFFISGTSNGTTALLQLPVAVSASWIANRPLLRVTNNGTVAVGYVRIPYGSGLGSIEFYRDIVGTAWTSTGSKHVEGEIWYEG